MKLILTTFYSIFKLKCLLVGRFMKVENGKLRSGTMREGPLREDARSRV